VEYGGDPGKISRSLSVQPRKVESICEETDQPCSVVWVLDGVIGVIEDINANNVTENL
jgi:hypothetical protein